MVIIYSMSYGDYLQHIGPPSYADLQIKQIHSSWFSSYLCISQWFEIIYCNRLLLKFNFFGCEKSQLVLPFLVIQPVITSRQWNLVSSSESLSSDSSFSDCLAAPRKQLTLSLFKSDSSIAYIFVLPSSLHDYSFCDTTQAKHFPLNSRCWWLSRFWFCCPILLPFCQANPSMPVTIVNNPATRFIVKKLFACCIKTNSFIIYACLGIECFLLLSCRQLLMLQH